MCTDVTLRRRSQFGLVIFLVSEKGGRGLISAYPECQSVVHPPGCHSSAVGMQLAQLLLLLGSPMARWASLACTGQARKDVIQLREL